MSKFGFRYLSVYLANFDTSIRQLKRTILIDEKHTCNRFYRHYFFTINIENTIKFFIALFAVRYVSFMLCLIYNMQERVQFINVSILIIQLHALNYY